MSRSNNDIPLANIKSLIWFIILLLLAACIEVSFLPNMMSQADASNKVVIDLTDKILISQSSNCADYVATYSSKATEIPSDRIFIGSLVIEVENNTCIFTSNSIPNHDMNDGDTFATPVAEQNQVYRLTTNPQKNSQTTALSPRYDNAILLNGVKIDLLSAGCFRVRRGCLDETIPWRYNAMSPKSFLKTDSHHAHTQENGGYHYHGNPKALFDDSDNSKASPVIGFAADGFPIFGSYFDDNGNIRQVRSSYQLKSGSRPSGAENPGGTYDGEFDDDYEYVEGFGDLDECNGMTVNGVYGYYVTDSYPYIMGCFSGTPDHSFRKHGGRALRNR